MTAVNFILKKIYIFPLALGTFDKPIIMAIRILKLRPTVSYVCLPSEQ